MEPPAAPAYLGLQPLLIQALLDPIPSAHSFPPNPLQVPLQPLHTANRLGAPLCLDDLHTETLARTDQKAAHGPEGCGRRGAVLPGL